MSWLDRFNSWYVHAVPNDELADHVHWTEPLPAARARQKTTRGRAIVFIVVSAVICGIVFAWAKPATRVQTALACAVLTAASILSTFLPPSSGWAVDVSPLRLRIVHGKSMRRVALRRIQRVIFWPEDGARLMSVNNHRGEILRLGVAPEQEPAVVELFRRAGIQVERR